MSLTRREFLKQAGAAAVAPAGALGASPGLLDNLLAARRAPAMRKRVADVVVIGAGAWGGWTALYLTELGASVTLVDQYGPGNARSTSGDETRGIRTAYGALDLWTRWASEAIGRWKERDEEWSAELGTQLFFTTGDVILRGEMDPFLQDTKNTWDSVGVPHEVLTADEVKYRWPVIGTEGINVALYEPDAGVGRARRSCEAVAEVVRRKGGRLVIGRATPGASEGERLVDVAVSGGEPLRADTFVFACGPWLPKALPEVMANRLRIPLGYVYYFGVPAGDHRFTHPNLPSFNFPGVTGWAALPTDHRGFRVRGGGGSGGGNAQDPDLSDRSVDPASFERPRGFLAERFPLLRDAPILQTHACHYEFSVGGNFIVDRHPRFANAWIAGGGNAEGFKMGPVIGEYIAHRALEMPTDATIDEQFRLSPEAFAA